MAKASFTKQSGDPEAWISIWLKAAPDNATNCPANVCANEDGWIPFTEGNLKDIPDTMWLYFKYQGQCSNEHSVKVKITADLNGTSKTLYNNLPIYPTDDGEIIGCNVIDGTNA